MMFDFEINGRVYRVDADPLTPLVVILRDELSLRGTKAACWQGRCGACTVEVDGRAVLACLFPAAKAALPHSVTTIEGIAPADGDLHPLQDEMVRGGGIQCGACTPGMVMSLHALLDEQPGADETAVRTAIGGNVCRCTGYERIVKAACRVRERHGTATSGTDGVN